MARARYLGMNFYPLTLGRMLPLGYDGTWIDPNTTNYNIKINGRYVLNFWKVARNELELRTTEFEGAVMEVLGKKVPVVNAIRMNAAWQDSGFNVTVFGSKSIS